MERAAILDQISELLDGKCNGCETYTAIEHEHRDNYTTATQYCREVCEIGARLQELGRELDRTVRPRVRPIDLDLEEI